VYRKWFNLSHLKVELCSRGLEPAFKILFSVISMVFPWGISNRVKPVEVGGSKSVVFCGGSTYKVFICVGRSLPSGEGTR
jgi:hypothetical protein